MQTRKGRTNPPARWVSKYFITQSTSGSGTGQPDDGGKGHRRSPYKRSAISPTDRGPWSLEVACITGGHMQHFNPSAPPTSQSGHRPGPAARLVPEMVAQWPRIVVRDTTVIIPPASDRSQRTVR